MTNNQMFSEEQIQAVKAEIQDRFPSAVANLGRLVKISGIAWDAFDAENLETSAKTVAELFESTGVFDSVEILRVATPEQKMGAPAVVARREAKNGAPQVLLYAHHDVQPPGDESDWKTPPFEPTLVDGRIYGRGAADDKAGITAHHTAIEALKAIAGDDFDLGITLFIEGEEEAGSPSFRNFLETHQDKLKADVIVVADSGNWSETVPAITTTLRGLVSQEIEVSTLDHAVHSGMYGGAVPDATTALIQLLASLHDSNGDVAVAGLNQGKAADLEYSESDLRRDSGLLDDVQPIGTGSILDRIWAKPAITVIGIDIPTVALSSNTMQPSIKAKISMRIAAGQEPQQALAALRAHLESNLRWGAKLAYGAIELGKPFETNDSGWAKPAMQQALSVAFDEESVDIGIGGSIPFIADLTEIFPSAQILVTGVEDPDSRAHSPNESLHVESLRKVIVAETLLLMAANQTRVGNQ
jgi:acetylornithine deacetylase/succinyl-diaminopimelate desuccinylase-like protein